MDYEDVINKLKEIDIENNIWIIYLGIIFLSWYSNSLEKDYLLSGNIDSKEKYRKIMIFIFIVLLCVYIYFFGDSLNSFNNLDITDSYNKKKLTELSLIASFLLVVSGIIFLYISFNDDNLDVELAFN